MKINIIIILTICFHMLSCAQGDPPTITVPSPLTVGIDDLGWKQGWSTDVANDPNKPHHIDGPEGRWMGLADYETIVNIGKEVNSRLLCLFIMSEFDRNNICANYPTTTEEGANWDNSHRMSDDDFKIMEFVKNNSAHMEFGLHGVRHEYWENGRKRNGEFANRNYNRQAYPVEKLQNHLHCYKQLLDQYGISFPKSFVPPKHCYYYNPLDSMDTGGLMASWGIKYVSWGHKYWNNYDTYALNPISNSLYNHGVLILERDQAVPWRNTVGTAPDSISTDFYYECTHWHNYVASKPDDNHLIAQKWIRWFNKINDSPDRYVPKNTAQLYSQALYLKYAKIETNGSKVFIDNANMPDWAYQKGFAGNLVIKVPLQKEEHVSSVTSNKNIKALSYYKERGFGYISLPMLKKDKYDIDIQTGNSPLLDCVINEGTYNIIQLNKEKEEITIELEMYGKQDVYVKLKNAEIVDIKSLSKGLIINSWLLCKETRLCTISVIANDVQGVRGKIVLQ